MLHCAFAQLHPANCIDHFPEIISDNVLAVSPHTHIHTHTHTWLHTPYVYQPLCTPPPRTHMRGHTHTMLLPPFLSWFLSFLFDLFAPYMCTLQHGADIRARAWGTFFCPGGPMSYGGYPLSFAACTGQKDVVAYLRRHGAQVNSDCDESGNTALHVCVIHDQPEMYDFLIEVWLAVLPIQSPSMLTVVWLAVLPIQSPSMLTVVWLAVLPIESPSMLTVVWVQAKEALCAWAGSVRRARACCMLPAIVYILSLRC